MTKQQVINMTLLAILKIDLVILNKAKTPHDKAKNPTTESNKDFLPIPNIIILAFVAV